MLNIYKGFLSAGDLDIKQDSTYPLSMGGMGCCIQVRGSRDSALSAALCGMLPNIVMASRGW